MMKQKAAVRQVLTINSGSSSIKFALFAATVDCLDSLVFNGGIGESSPLVRQGICEGLEFLDLLQLDALNKP